MRAGRVAVAATLPVAVAVTCTGVAAAAPGVVDTAGVGQASAVAPDVSFSTGGEHDSVLPSWTSTARGTGPGEGERRRGCRGGRRRGARRGAGAVNAGLLVELPPLPAGLPPLG
ncbi:hypothetical protein ACFYVR_21950 [Rhodococcus sp. NPDC003318]|uniref:hypothetical protein n=1 Tax=Rhodococcus sp. NPDC003318 TaxID=3364503 RepID=UPI00369C9C85